jgi:hypothetical protein
MFLQQYVANLGDGMCHGVRLRLRDCHCQWQGQLPLPGAVAMALPGTMAMALSVAAPPFPQVYKGGSPPRDNSVVEPRSTSHLVARARRSASRHHESPDQSSDQSPVQSPDQSPDLLDYPNHYSEWKSRVIFEICVVKFGLGSRQN